MSIYAILIKREQSGAIPILQMCLQRHREVTCPRSHSGTAGKAHGLNLSVILSSHLSLKGETLKNAKGEPELSET